MCRFNKTKRSTERKSRSVSKTGIGKTNLLLGFASVMGVVIFTFLALLNTSFRLDLSQLERETQDLGVANNSLSMDISRTQVDVSNEQGLVALGLVDVGNIEYAQSQSSAVALR